MTLRKKMSVLFVLWLKNFLDITSEVGGGKDNGRQIPLEDITIYIYKEELVPYCSVKLALTSNFV